MEILGGSPAGVIDESAVRTARGDEVREGDVYTRLDVVLGSEMASGSDTYARNVAAMVAGVFQPVTIKHGIFS